MEQWRTVTDFPNYEISNYGNVKNIITNKLLNPYNKKGYKMVNLVNNLGTLEKRVHRLVALAFIPNPSNYDCINHIDENRGNNHYTNLEWCNHQYNNTFGNRINKAKLKQNKKVGKYSLQNVLIKEYNSINEAAIDNNIVASNISNCLKERQKTSAGFIWKYL